MKSKTSNVTSNSGHVTPSCSLFAINVDVKVPNFTAPERCDRKEIHHPNASFAVKEQTFSSNRQLRCRKVNRWRYLPGVLEIAGLPEVLCGVQLIAGNLSGHNLFKTVTLLG